jgi:hypothetical protein
MTHHSLAKTKISHRIADSETVAQVINGLGHKFGHSVGIAEKLLSLTTRSGM